MSNTRSASPRRELRGVLQSLISRTFALEGLTIQRQSTTELTLNDSAHSRVTVRGATALQPSAWLIYRGHFGTWEALVSPSLWVGVPYPVEAK